MSTQTTQTATRVPATPTPPTRPRTRPWTRHRVQLVVFGVLNRYFSVGGIGGALTGR